MSVAEVEKRIDECIKELDRFKALSPEARTAIENLQRLKSDIKALTKEKAQEWVKLIDELSKRASAYASFIPKTVENIKFIRDWLQKQAA
jgi:predicted  nucleic acid-binding Zn-ribbon protein